MLHAQASPLMEAREQPQKRVPPEARRARQTQGRRFQPIATNNLPNLAISSGLSLIDAMLESELIESAVAW